MGEKNENTWGGAREGSGRPRIKNNPNKMRSMRMSDDEYGFVRWALKQYRAGATTIIVKDWQK